MDAFLFPFMEEKRKFIFPDDFRHGADGTEISGGKRGQRVNIMFHRAVVQVGDNVARHIDQDDTVNAKRDQIFLKDFLDSVQLFLTECVRQFLFLRRFPICEPMGIIYRYRSEDPPASPL